MRTRSSVGSSPEPGPLLVDEYDTTVVVPPEWSVRREGQTGAMVLERAGRLPDATILPIHRSSRQKHRRGSDHPAGRGQALASIADEMATTIYRTAHSTVVRDAMDFSASL